jgi:hypothetical protein
MNIDVICQIIESDKGLSKEPIIDIAIDAHISGRILKIIFVAESFITKYPANR